MMKLLVAIVVGMAANVALAAETLTLDVQGMTCVTCPITVRKVLEKTPGVIAAEADLKSKTATVSYDPAKTSPLQLAKVVSDVGFPATIKKAR